jgi:hypothetical protein
MRSLKERFLKRCRRIYGFYHHGKIRIEPDGFPIGAKQPIGNGVKGATPDGSERAAPGLTQGFLARRNISSEALRVNVRSMIRLGLIPCETTRPSAPQEFWSCPCRAPAMVRTGPSPAMAARSCSGFRSSSRDSGMSPQGYGPSRPTSSHGGLK